MSSLLTSTSLDLLSSSVNITTSSGNWNWEGIASPYSAPYCHPPRWYPPPYPPSQHLQPAAGFLPFADLTNHYSGVGDQSGFADSGTRFVANMPSGTCGIVEPFVVKKLNGRIKVCTGCRGQHLKGANNELLPPSFDICLCHREPQVYTNPKTG